LLVINSLRIEDRIGVDIDEVKMYAEEHGLIFFETCGETSLKWSINEMFNKIARKLNQDFKSSYQDFLSKINEQVDAPFYDRYKRKVIDVVSENWQLYKSFPENLRDDSEITLRATKQNVLALQYASMRLRSDKDFMKQAISINSEAFNYVSKQLQDDSEIISIALQKGYIFNPSKFIIEQVRILTREETKQEIVFTLISLHKKHLKPSDQLTVLRLSIQSPHNADTLFELFSEFVNASTNIPTEELRDWGRRHKMKVKWKQNIEEVSQYLSNNYVPNIDIEVATYFSNYRPRGNLITLGRKVYSKELYIELNLLKQVSKHFEKYNDRNTSNNYVNKDAGYYFLIDFIRDKILSINAVQEINIQNINSFNFKITEIFNKQDVDIFISTWINMENFPKLPSINELVNDNMEYLMEQRAYASVIRSKLPQYVPKSILGKGGEGIVFECYNLTEQRTRAMKISLKPTIANSIS